MYQSLAEKSEQKNIVHFPIRKNIKLRNGEKKRKPISKMQFSLEYALNEVTTSPNAIRRWMKLCLSYVEFVSPAEALQEPTRLMKILAEHSCGLKREEILSLFYEKYSESSLSRQTSYRVCLEKIIQRARGTFAKYDLTVYFCPETKRYFSLPLFILQQKNSLK